MAATPLLPGYQITQPRKEKYPKVQTLEWKKGVPLSHHRPATASPSTGQEFEFEDLASKELRLQFGTKRHHYAKRFLPKWAIYDKKVLQFNGYFTETLGEDASIYAVRKIILCYYLIDDAISLHEPKTNNSGLTQGVILKRQRIPRTFSRTQSLHEEGENANCFEGQHFWHWSDLNIGTIISLYGRKYVLTNCDKFTKEFLLSEGTELNQPIDIPIDPYETLRNSRRETPQRFSDLRITSTSRGCLYQSLRDVILKFNVMVEEIVNESECKATAAVLSYRMADDKIEIRKPMTYEDVEIKRFSPLLLKWSKVPLKDVKRTNIADIGEEDEFGSMFLHPGHLGPPTTLTIYGRKILVTGCDEETSCILEKYFDVVGAPVNSCPKSDKAADKNISQGRVITDIMVKPKIKHGVALESKVLRFSAILDSARMEDQNRTFILSFYTIDSTFELYEKPRSGGFGGRILARTRIPKGKSSSKTTNNGYFSLEDLYIGNQLNIWGILYTITGADKYVHTYAEENTQAVPLKILNSLRNHFREDQSQDTVAEDQV